VRWRDHRGRWRRELLDSGAGLSLGEEARLRTRATDVWVRTEGGRQALVLELDFIDGPFQVPLSSAAGD
jgi:hypothetical protein